MPAVIDDIGIPGKRRCTLTIVVANYNHGRYLPQCLAAILAQTRSPDEILIIDDASTDDSLDVISEFGPRMPMLRTIRHSINKGVITTMNEGLLEASSTHVLFAAADDWIEPGLVETSMRLMDQFPGAGLCSALTRLADEAGNITGPFRTRIPSSKAGYISSERVAKLLIDDDAWFNGNTTIVKRGAALDAGGYRPELNAYADMFLNVTLALRHGACFVPRFLAVWRRMPVGFASALNANPSAMSSTFDAVQRLMTASEQNIFLPQYIARWASRWRFTAARGVIATDSGVRQDWLSMLLPGGGRTLGFVIGQISRIPLFGGSLAIALLFLLLRPRDITSVLKRRIGWIFREQSLMRAG